MMKNIPFNKAFVSDKGIEYISDALKRKNISGNGYYTKQCEDFFKEKFSFHHSILTTSCTHALEMSALLCEIQPGDEVLLPSYTFVSTANAFVLRGAKIKLIDSSDSSPNLSINHLRESINPKTKALVVVHYAGISCQMDEIVTLCKENGVLLVEDAAQGFNAFYKNKALGNFGDYAAFSFHETKNISCGEGGLLLVNNPDKITMARCIWDKGTNRYDFLNGKVDKYDWVSVGSSYLPSELITSFLYAQLSEMELIQNKRMSLWEAYFDGFEVLEKTCGVKRPEIPEFCKHNAHLFFIKCLDRNDRIALTHYLSEHGVQACFHYPGLHNSPYFQKHYQNQQMPFAQSFADCLLRLPLYPDMNLEEVHMVLQMVYQYYKI